MMKKNVSRRGFLRKSFAGIACSTMLAGSTRAELIGDLDRSLPQGVADPADERYWRLLSQCYVLQTGLQYFNNASLGPSPRFVIDATDAYRRMLEGYPSKYMWTDWWDDLERVRARAAAFLNCKPEEMALTHNTTEGLNLVAASLELQPGDEVIIGDHEHHTGVVPFQHFQESRGVRLVRPTTPLMPDSPGEIVDLYRSHITSRTRAILMCHMINTNGMILPVEEVCSIARERSIVTVIDGAQSIAMLPVDVRKIGCDFYACSGHKWLHGPKGTGLFYTRRDRQHLLKPLIVCGMYYKADDARRFENYNTRNMPEVLGLGSALEFHGFIGAKQRSARIYHLKHLLRQLCAEVPGLTITTPADDRLSAGITDVEVAGMAAPDAAAALAERHQIDCRPMTTHGLNALRISTAIFNTADDVRYLVEGLRELTAG